MVGQTMRYKNTR